MKWSIILFTLILFILIDNVNAQKYGLGNTDPSVFTKFRIPETDLSTIWFNTNLYLYSYKNNYSYLEPDIPSTGSSFNSSLRYNLNPNYYLLKESENNYLSVRGSLSGSYYQEYSEDYSSTDKQKYTSHYKDYGTNINLSFTDNNYICPNDIFYSLGSNIQVTMEENKSESYGSVTNNTFNGSKGQNYSFSVGMGIGKRRNVTPVVSAIRFQERLKQVNMLNGDLSEKTIEDLAQQFYKQSYYSTVHERPDKYFWQDIEKTLSNDGVTLKDLNMYADAYLRESVNEVRFQRGEVFIGGFNFRGQYQNNYYVSEGNGSNIDEQFFTLGEAYFTYSHQLNLNSQLNLGVTLNGGPNIIKYAVERQQYLLLANAGYNYELTDRLVASFNNTFSLEFLNYEKEEKFLSNALSFSMRYFIEDNLSLNANYNWSYDVNKRNFYQNNTNNDHSINIGFTYYFEKGFLLTTDDLTELAMNIIPIRPITHIYNTVIASKVVKNQGVKVE
ncbi:MAG: hypothetical protein P4L27_06025 [Ignavibacteriaceae bacterium]|nr:hypothetical protein [Ignavibacteriaceae bacterium]